MSMMPTKFLKIKNIIPDTDKMKSLKSLLIIHLLNYPLCTLVGAYT